MATATQQPDVAPLATLGADDAGEKGNETLAEKPKRGRKPKNHKESPVAAASSKPSADRRYLVTMRHSPALKKSLILTGPNIDSKEAAKKRFFEINAKAAKESRAPQKNMAAWDRAMSENPPTWTLTIQEFGVDVDDEGRPFNVPKELPPPSAMVMS